jgi:integrase
LSAFWEHFIQTSPPPAESTRALYAMQARTHILPRLGHVPLHAITRPMVKSFLADLHEEGVKDPSINGAYRLRRVLAVAVEEGRITQNPAARIQAPRSAPREMNFLSASEVDALSRAVEHRYEALILCLAFTGTRIGEAAALRMKNVDLLRRQVRIVEASKEVEGRLHLGPTKNRRNRSVTCPAPVGQARHPRRAVLQPGRSGGARVPRSLGRRSASDGVPQPRLPAGGDQAGLDAKPEATRPAAHGGGPGHPGELAPEAQEMLGHSSIEVTLGTYGHLFDSLHGEGADRLDAIYAEAAKARDADVVELSSRTRAS